MHFLPILQSLLINCFTLQETVVINVNGKLLFWQCIPVLRVCGAQNVTLCAAYIRNYSWC